jgi:hypothetical protein
MGRRCRYVYHFLDLVELLNACSAVTSAWATAALAAVTPEDNVLLATVTHRIKVKHHFFFHAIMAKQLKRP